MKGKLLLITMLVFAAFAMIACKQPAKQNSEAAVTENTTVDVPADNEAAEEDSSTEEKDTDIPATPTVSPTEVPVAEGTADASDDTVTYKDGIYEVQTEPDYEKYYTKATVTIEGGKVTSVDWCIYDTNLEDKPFDEEYYHVYDDVSALYVQQAKDDWTGSRGYSDVLIECQDINEVDAVSGATWTNKKFKEIVRMALGKATE